MPLVSISEAARLAGVSRKTVQRYIDSGKLSATSDGTASGTGAHPLRQVEISELIRVFGELKADMSHPVAGTAQGQSRSVSMDNVAPVAPLPNPEKTALEQVISAQQGTIDLLHKQVDELREEKRELRAQVVGLLEYRKSAEAPAASTQAPPAQQEAPKKSGLSDFQWWALIIMVAIAGAILGSNLTRNMNM